MTTQAQVQAPQQNADYIQHHPNAVIDPHKAEIMAYASKDLEVQVVEQRKLALDAASNLGNSVFRGIQNMNAESAANLHVNSAFSARIEADEKANTAASIYDKVHGL
jgi:hypothetical protein